MRDAMMVVKDGRVMWMIYDAEKNEWKYIPEREFKEE